MKLRLPPMPDRMKLLPVDRRGFPVPYIVMWDDKGEPQFAVNDNHKTVLCGKRKICPICGKKLPKELWFVGGPLSAFHPHGCYHDTAMHHECMTYALMVCPYLAMRKYTAPPAETRLPALAKKFTGRVSADPTMDPAKPEVLVAVMSYGQSRDTAVIPHIRPLRPYHAVEFWTNGHRLSFYAGVAIIGNNPDLKISDINSALRLAGSNL